MNRTTETVQVIRSRRKTISVEIRPGRGVIVRAPLQCPDREIRRVLEEKRDWIETHLARMREREALIQAQPEMTWEELEQLAEEACRQLPQRLGYWADRMGLRYGRVTIRNQKTRWGSCSTKKNINLNVMLMLCPQEVQDYVLVHELCHLREMNHSGRFWAEVERVLPEYRKARAWLKKNGAAVLARMPG